MRLSRLLARTGVFSRRQADAAIAAGRVTCNGEVSKLGDRIEAESAHKLRITVDKKPVLQGDIRRSARPRVFLTYKKRGELVTRLGTDDRASVFARLGLDRHVAAVGRLDYASEGLLVLTTCGMLARGLEHPDIGALNRTYEVTTRGIITSSKLTAMRRGVRVGDKKYRPLKVEVLQTGSSEATFEFRCTEGKNRMIRRICDHLRLRVTKLVRTQYGPFTLAQLKPGYAATEVRLPRSLAHLTNPIHPASGRSAEPSSPLR